MKKILLFGAGKIGRSFIGQLFSKAEYEIVFTDINKEIVDLLNEKGCYKVITRDNNHPEKEGDHMVRNVSAIHLNDREQLIDSIVNADIIAVSVGKRGLISLSGLLAAGIEKRYFLKKDDPIDIILAENDRNAASIMRKQLLERLTKVPIEQYVGLVETSIGKMVPITPEEQIRKDPLSIIAEPYNTLIVDQLAFRNVIPNIDGLAPKSAMKAWVDRKVFIHNMGHAALAYQANFYNPSLKYTWEALAVKSIWEITQSTMLQSAEILLDIYPAVFTRNQLSSHIDDLLERFSNKALSDTIFRVGCDLSRKLNSDDRLMIPILAGLERGKEYSLILEAWVKGCSFMATDEKGEPNQGDKIFFSKYGGDPNLILARHCKIDGETYSTLYKIVRELADRKK